MRKIPLILAAIMLFMAISPLSAFAEDSDVPDIDDKYAKVTFDMDPDYEAYVYENAYNNLIVDDTIGFIPHSPLFSRELSEYPCATYFQYCNTAVYLVEKGTYLSEDELPTIVSEALDFAVRNYNPEPTWSEDPCAKPITEDVTFYATPVDSGEYTVKFLAESHTCVKQYDHLKAGASVEPPCMDPYPLGLEDDLVFVGWQEGREDRYGDYKNVQRNVYVYAINKYLGDMNQNDEIESGDAALILRCMVNNTMKPEYFDRLADMNKNGKADSADVTMLLRACVGLED